MTLEMESDNSVIYLSKDTEHTSQFHYSARVDFYLWGLYPDQGRFIFVDEILTENGIRESSGLEFHSYRTWRDSLVTITSFGMYAPLRYDLTLNYRD